MNAASNSAPTSAPPPDNAPGGEGGTLSLRRRNALRAGRGADPLYKESSLGGPGMEEARRALTTLLGRGEPFPVFVTDRHWHVVAANDAGRRMLGLMLGEARMARPLNFLQLFLAPDELRRHIVNWPPVAAALLRRAARDLAAAPDDDALRAIWSDLAADAEVAALIADPDQPAPVALCEVRFAAQGREIGLIGVTAAFAAPQDITLDELRIESFVPADDESEDILFRMAAPG